VKQWKGVLFACVKHWRGLVRVLYLLACVKQWKGVLFACVKHWRGLVRVLYLLACVKQWGGDKCFTLFRLVASIVSNVQCIDDFTHNSLRNKGDTLAALSGTHRTIYSKKLNDVVGWKAANNQRLIIITICEELRWIWCYAWFGMIDFISVNCYLNAMLSIYGHVLFGNFFYEYHCLWLAYPYLFVCVFVACVMIV